MKFLGEAPNVVTPVVATCDPANLSPDGKDCTVSLAGNVPDRVIAHDDGTTSWYLNETELFRIKVVPGDCPPEWKISPFGECVCPAGQSTPEGGCFYPTKEPGVGFTGDVKSAPMTPVVKYAVIGAGAIAVAALATYLVKRK